MRFSIKLGDLELRSCNSYLLSDGLHTTAEIVRWSNLGRTCYTLANWTQNKDKEFSLQFIGDRPFEVQASLFMKLAERGQSLLFDIET